MTARTTGAASRLVVGFGWLLLAVPSVARAHGGGTHAASGWVVPALIVAGLVLAGASAYLDANDAVSARAADAGVVAGTLAVVASAALTML